MTVAIFAVVAMACPLSSPLVTLNTGVRGRRRDVLGTEHRPRAPVAEAAGGAAAWTRGREPAQPGCWAGRQRAAPPPESPLGACRPLFLRFSRGPEGNPEFRDPGTLGLCRLRGGASETPAAPKQELPALVSPQHKGSWWPALPGGAGKLGTPRPPRGGQQRSRGSRPEVGAGLLESPRGAGRHRCLAPAQAAGSPAGSLLGGQGRHRHRHRAGVPRPGLGAELCSCSGTADPALTQRTRRHCARPEVGSGRAVLGAREADPSRSAAIRGTSGTGRGGAAGAACGFCKFQLLPHVVNWLLRVTQAAGSPSPSHLHQKNGWLPTPPSPPRAPRGVRCGLRTPAEEESGRDRGHRAARREAWRCHWLWAWHVPCLLRASVFASVEWGELLPGG